MTERMERQFAFALEADKEKNIVRQTLISDGSRRENDAEHAWHAALMAVLLSEYANSGIDVLRTVTMLLIHDMVEIDAGDTYAYDEQAKLTQRDREEKAADRVFGLLPDDQRDRFRALWEEFEACETAESRFAHAMDNIQPAMLNNATDGRVWLERGVRLGQILDRNRSTPEGSRALWDYSLNRFILPNRDKGRIRDEERGLGSV